MKKAGIFSLFVLFSLSGTFLSAQNLNSLVIGSSGRYVNTGSQGLHYNTGELAINTNDDNAYLTQGFIQPEMLPMSTSISEKEVYETGYVSYYPNPVENQLNIIFKSAKNTTGVNLRVISVSGKVIEQKLFDTEYRENQVQLNCSHWTPGVYVVRLIETSGKVHSFKVIKTQ